MLFVRSEAAALSGNMRPQLSWIVGCAACLLLCLLSASAAAQGEKRLYTFDLTYTFKLDPHDPAARAAPST
ncbi:MAG: hypothetical protein JWN14_3598, partial [Chthonomonadales bacterium]|nr:hypothetical protein [Chthonomonadales bacterium]